MDRLNKEKSQLKYDYPALHEGVLRADAIVMKELIQNKEMYADVLNKKVGFNKTLIQTIITFNESNLFKELLPVIDFKQTDKDGKNLLGYIIEYADVIIQRLAVSAILKDKIAYKDWMGELKSVDIINNDNESYLLEDTLISMMRYLPIEMISVIKELEKDFSVFDIRACLNVISAWNSDITPLNAFVDALKSSCTNIDDLKNDLVKVLYMMPFVTESDFDFWEGVDEVFLNKTMLRLEEYKEGKDLTIKNKVKYNNIKL